MRKQFTCNLWYSNVSFARVALSSVLFCFFLPFPSSCAICWCLFASAIGKKHNCDDSGNKFKWHRRYYTYIRATLEDASGDVDSFIHSSLLFPLSWGYVAELRVHLSCQDVMAIIFVVLVIWTAKRKKSTSYSELLLLSVAGLVRINLAFRFFHGHPLATGTLSLSLSLSLSLFLVPVKMLHRRVRMNYFCAQVTERTSERRTSRVYMSRVCFVSPKKFLEPPHGSCEGTKCVFVTVSGASSKGKHMHKKPMCWALIWWISIESLIFSAEAKRTSRMSEREREREREKQELHGSPSVLINFTCFTFFPLVI